MLVNIYKASDSETLEEFEVSDPQVVLELIKRFGYSDLGGNEYKFVNACVEYPHTFFIYVTD